MNATCMQELSLRFQFSEDHRYYIDKYKIMILEIFQKLDLHVTTFTVACNDANVASLPQKKT